MKYFRTRLAIDRRYWLMTVLLVIITIVDLLIIGKQRFSFSGQFLTFLAGSSLGHYPQMALLWLLPAYLMIGPSRWYLQDVKAGQVSLLVTRMKKRQYLGRLLRMTFCSTFISILLALLLNYALALVVFRHGSGSGNRMSDFQGGVKPFLHWQLLHPTITNLMTILIAAVLIGLLATAIMAVSFIFKKTSYVFALSMVAWFIPISTNYSIMGVLQPFQETALRTQALILAIYTLILLGITWMGYRSEVKRDEL